MNVIDFPDRKWRAKLLHENTKNGARVIPHVENAIVYLLHHPKWKGRLRYDVFAHRMLISDPPWHDTVCDSVADESERDVTDEDAIRLAAWFMRDEMFDVRVSTCWAAITIAARTQSFHPVKDYFAKLTWDQRPRLSTFASAYLGAVQTEYAALVVRWWMISAVARTYDPGCVAQYVLILEGDQGPRKSQALKTLAGAKWFSDTRIDIESKDAFLSIPGNLIYELAEIDGNLRKSESAAAKNFFSSSVDRFRPPYGRAIVSQRRSCVFAGTTNPIGEGYFTDPSGNRRYWPIACGTRIDVEAIARDRDQLWAEAIHWYRAGARWYPDTTEENALCRGEQADRTESDAWEAEIAKYLTGKTDTSTGECLSDALHIETGKWTRGDQTRVGIVLTKLGWKGYRAASNSVGGRPRRYHFAGKS